MLKKLDTLKKTVSLFVTCLFTARILLWWCWFYAEFTICGYGSL